MEEHHSGLRVADLLLGHGKALRVSTSMTLTALVMSTDRGCVKTR